MNRLGEEPEKIQIMNVGYLICEIQYCFITNQETPIWLKSIVQRGSELFNTKIIILNF